MSQSSSPELEYFKHHRVSRSNSGSTLISSPDAEKPKRRRLTMGLRRSRCIKLLLVAVWITAIWYLLQNLEHHSIPSQDKLAIVTFAVKFKQHEWGSNQPMPNQAEDFNMDADQVKKVFASYMTLTLRNMLSYAQRWGIPFFFLNSGIVKTIVQNSTDPDGIHPYWAKTAVVKHYMDMKTLNGEPKFDWILWTDIDVLFTRFEIPLTEFIPSVFVDYDAEDGVHIIAPTECDFDPEFVSVTSPFGEPRQQTLVDIPKPWPKSFWNDKRIDEEEIVKSKDWYNASDWWEKERNLRWANGEDVVVTDQSPPEPDTIFPPPYPELKAPARAIRSGFFMIRNSKLGKRFLKDWANLWPVFKDSPNPDQSALEYLVHGNHSLSSFWRSRLIMHSPFFHSYPECSSDATPFKMPDDYPNADFVPSHSPRVPMDLGFAYLGAGGVAYSSNYPWHRGTFTEGYDGKGAFSLHFPAPTRKTEVASWYAKVIPDDEYGKMEELWFGPGSGNLQDNASLTLTAPVMDPIQALNKVAGSDVARGLYDPIVDDATTLQVLDTVTIPFQLKVRAMGYNLPTSSDWPKEVEERRQRELSGTADLEWNDRRLSVMDDRWDKVVVISCGHQDDWQLFMNPVVFHATSKSASWYSVLPPRIVIIYLTAGDAGMGMGDYVLAREKGTMGAIRFLVDSAGGGSGWDDDVDGAKDVSMHRIPYEKKGDTEYVVVNGHKIKSWRYANVVSYYLRLPDGNIDGLGFDKHFGATVVKLKNGEIQELKAVDGSTVYQGWKDLQDTYLELISKESRVENRGGIGWKGETEGGSRPLEITLHALETNQLVNVNDHPDHTMASYLAQFAIDRILTRALIKSVDGDVLKPLPVICSSIHLHLAYITGENLAVNLEPGTDDYLANVGTYAVMQSELAKGGGGNGFLDWAGHTLWLNKVYRRMVYPKALNLARFNPERTEELKRREERDVGKVSERLCPMLPTSSLPRIVGEDFILTDGERNVGKAEIIDLIQRKSRNRVGTQ